MKTWFSIALIIASLSCGAAFADGAKKSEAEELNKAYAEYQRLAAEQKWRESLPQASRAYELAVKLLGQKRETVVIAFDYGMNLKEVRDYAGAGRVLEKALEYGETVYGKDSKDLMPILTNLGLVSIQTQHNDYKPYLDRALLISGKAYGAESLETGKFMLQIADDILRESGSKKAREYVFGAYNIMKKQLGEKHELTGYAAMNVGKFHLMRGDYKDAKKYLTETLNTFADPDAPDGRIEMITHGFLVEVNERLGKSEEATRHCLAIGRMTPVQSTQDYFPVFKPAPTYPPAAGRAGTEGHAIVEFTVDSSGFVLDPRVVQSTDPIFNESSVEAAKKFRYAPKFVDGKPVTVNGVRNKIIYRMDRKYKEKKALAGSQG